MSVKILVIDDEPNIRTMVRLALEHTGYEVDIAQDGEEGLQKFGDGSNWDLVLVDQRMPGMAGIEVQKIISKRKPDARLILITAFGTIDLALEAIQAGAVDFLRKPFTADTLRSAVKSALEKPVKRLGAVPIGMVCREFTRTTINGFSFEFDEIADDPNSNDHKFHFRVTQSEKEAQTCTVILPVYVMELVKAYADTEQMPGGLGFWQALCEEALADYLWQNAGLPDNKVLRIEELSSSLQRWLDAVLTVRPIKENA